MAVTAAGSRMSTARWRSITARSQITRTLGDGGGIDNTFGTLTLTEQYDRGQHGRQWRRHLQRPECDADGHQHDHRRQRRNQRRRQWGRPVCRWRLGLAVRHDRGDEHRRAARRPAISRWAAARCRRRAAYNLIGTGGSGGLTQGSNGNQVGIADPALGSLASNGGSTQTIAVLPGSPAIGNGASTISGITIPTTDQRGVARPSGSVRHRRIPGPRLHHHHRLRRQSPVREGQHRVRQSPGGGRHESLRRSGPGGHRLLHRTEHGRLGDPERRLRNHRRQRPGAGDGHRQRSGRQLHA